MDPAPVKHRLKDAAEKIGISVATLRVKIKQGQIGVENHSSRVRYIHETEINSYCARRQQNHHAII